jgi:hypothetical protein
VFCAFRFYSLVITCVYRNVKYVFSVMDSWTWMNLTQFAEHCFEMTKGRYILWNPRNYKMCSQFSTETRYVDSVWLTYLFIYLFFWGEEYNRKMFLLCKWFVYFSLYLYNGLIWLFYLLLLSIGWTDRQGRVCILLE